MYDNEAKCAQGGLAVLSQRRLEVTLGENIDEQINMAQKRLDDLKASKERLKKTGLLDSRIDDLQVAMRY